MKVTGFFATRAEGFRQVDSLRIEPRALPSRQVIDTGTRL